MLDEASANLDLATEAAINANLARLGLTRVVISHRPQTIQGADRILDPTRSPTMAVG